MKKMLHLVLQPQGMFVIIALVLGISFIKIIPPLWGVDEITHFNRVYQYSTATVEIIEQHKYSGSYADKLPANLESFEGYVYKGLTDGKPYASAEADDYNNYGSLHFSRATKIAPPVDVYSPLAYVAPVAGVDVSRLLNLDIGQTIFMARLFTLLTYIGIVFIGLRLLRRTKTVWLVFVVALLPMALFQASIVSVDSESIGLSLLLFSMMVWFWQYSKKLSKRELIAILSVSTVLALTKPNYALLGITAAFLPAKVLGKRIFNRSRAALVGLPLLVCAAWELHVSKLSNTEVIQQLGATAKHISLVGQTKFILTHPFQVIYYTIDSANKADWFHETFGLLGWNFIYIPVSITCLLVVALCVVSLYDKDSPEKHSLNRFQPTLFLGVGILLVLSIIYVFYATYTVVGSPGIEGVQGRYFLPAIPFVFYGAARLLPIRVVMSEKVVKIIVPCVSIFALATSVAVYFQGTY